MNNPIFKYTTQLMSINEMLVKIIRKILFTNKIAYLAYNQIIVNMSN